MDDGQEVEPVHLRKPAVPPPRWTWRLVLAAGLIGAVSALAAAFVRLGFRGLQWVLTGSGEDPPFAATHLPVWRRALTPAVGALLAAGVLAVRRRREKHKGQPSAPYVEYVEAVRHEDGFIPLGPNCWRTLSASFSVASGAAVGREGSMIQFAAAVASTCARWRGWLDGDNPAQLSLLVACGVAGGVTAAYNAPIAGTFFAAEIVLGAVALAELPLLGLAAAAGWAVSGVLLGRERLYPVHVALAWGWELWSLPLLAVAAGLAGPVYQWLLGTMHVARRLPVPVLWGGIVVGGLSVLDPRVWGNGDVGLRAALSIGTSPGAPAGAMDLGRVLLLRLVATLACVWTGTIGGVFTPTLFAGGVAGALLAHGLGAASTGLWAIAGMSFLMAAVTHAPVMAAFVAVELTGDWSLLPVLLPMNFACWWIAQKLSARSMYAIASQSPAQGDEGGVRDLQRGS